MARYKNRTGSPINSQRINGQQWTTGNGGGTIHGWGYPISRASAQFKRYNDNARQLDESFQQLDPATQAAWHAKSMTDEDWIICVLINQYYQYYGH